MMEPSREPGANRHSSQDESALVGRCREGDSAAFGILVERYRDRADVIRNRTRREVAVDDPARVERVDAAGDLSADAAVTARMERLIGELPETARGVVTLFYYRDLSVAEIASALGIPEGTVKTHLFRARAALREGWLRECGTGDDDAL